MSWRKTQFLFGFLQRRPFFVFEDGSVVIFDVIDNIPYLTTLSNFAKIGDEIVEAECGVSFSVEDGQCWAYFPVGLRNTLPALPNPRGRPRKVRPPQSGAPEPVSRLDPPFRVEC